MKLCKWALGVGLMLSMAGVAQAALPGRDSQDTPLPSLAPMLEQVTPAVVNIATSASAPMRDNPLLQDPFFRRFFGIPDVPQERRTQSLGSGVVVDAAQGYVLTNHHVINNAQEITVTLRDGRSFSAEVIGSDPETDVAVIQIPAENLKALPLANSDQLRVGDFVVAIGNPFGLGQTVTSGIVSALGRSGLGIEGYEDFIQTDASINPGNSGGALVNLRGELVGINTAIVAPSGGNVGIGFAIPVNMARNLVEQLVEYGEIRRGRLGVATQTLTPDLAKAFNIPWRAGVVVSRVETGSAAERAGLRVGDIVTAINDRPMRNSSEMRNAIGLLRAGSEVRISIIRDGEPRLIRATMELPKREQVDGKTYTPWLSGAMLSLIGTDSPWYGKLEGLMVAAVANGSTPWKAGLRPGDVIVSVNRVPVKNFDTLAQALHRSERGVLLNIRRGNLALFITIQ